MIIVLSFIIFYIGGSMTQSYSGPPAPPVIDMKTKPVMCSYNFKLDSTTAPPIGIECFPCECEIIVIDNFSISNKSVITVDLKSLKHVTSLKPTIVVVHRDGGYTDWDTLLTPGPDSYKKDAEVLCKFAIENNILGYELENISPDPNALTDSFTPSVMDNLPDYLKLLKFSDYAVIGVRIYTWKAIITNPCITNFAGMNEVVNFYDICTYITDGCEPSLSMFVTPIVAKDHDDPDYQFGMEEITGFLKKTKIDHSKAYYIADIIPKNSPSQEDFSSYDEVCRGKSSNFDTWCIPHTKDFYDKGAYIKSENCGIIIMYIQLDDVNNACGCGPFIGFQNLIAGYKGGSVLPCSKFDVGVEPK